MKIMTRSEILQKEREKVFTNLAEDKGSRAKWLTILMDIEDEMEEMEKMDSRNVEGILLT